MKRTLVFGASPNPTRYSYLATLRLAEHGHEVFPVGIREGQIEGHKVLTNAPIIEDIDTVTLYIGKKRQPEHYNYILNQINPKRIIFNPGTENEEFMALAKDQNIATEIGCTLVMLSIGNY